jgi:hypothetical protein
MDEYGRYMIAKLYSLCKIEGQNVPYIGFDSQQTPASEDKTYAPHGV